MSKHLKIKNKISLNAMKNEEKIINYVTTNLVNGKQYIGTHRTKNVNDSYIGSGLQLKRAISKYGKENFKKEVLCVYNSTDIQIAQEIEAKLIQKVGTLSPNGYNLSPTGGTFAGGKHSEDSKLLITGRPKEPITFEDVKKAILKYPNRTINELADQFGVVRNTIKHRLMEGGYGNPTQFRFSHGLLM